MDFIITYNERQRRIEKGEKKRKNIFVSLFIFYIFSALCKPSFAVTPCAEGKGDVCVTTKQQGNSVAFYVDNKNTYDITITIKLTNMENAAADVDLPYTVSVEGNKGLKAFVLSVIDDNSSWSYNYVFNWTIGIVNAGHDDSYIYNLPYESGTTHKVVQGYNGSFSHYGDSAYAIDFVMPEGTKIIASRDGVVVGVRDTYTEGGITEEYKNRQNYIMIKHSDGTIASYEHIYPNSAKVKVGQQVHVGDFIALSGNVGYSTTPHLHFFVFKAVDGYERKSFEVKFRSPSTTPYTIVEGESYTAP